MVDLHTPTLIVDDDEAMRRMIRTMLRKIGFSDVTALHQAIALRSGVASFHGPMLNLDFYNGLSPEREQWFWSMLAGDAPLTHSFAANQVGRYSRKALLHIGEQLCHHEPQLARGSPRSQDR